MNLLGAALYDPAGAVSKSTASLIAMTAFDTTNLRLAITVPAHGLVRFRLRCTYTGATTVATVLLGVLNGATVVGRVAPMFGPFTANATTQDYTFDAEFTATGLTPGAMNVDAAYGVEVVVAATNIKYGGPNNTTGNDAWGAFVFEAWDPRPMKLALDGGVNVTQWNGTAVSAPATAGIPDVNVKNINNVAAATPGAANGILISGSNAGTTTLGALTVTGATTLTGNMVLSDGLTISAPSTGNRAGLSITGNGTGAGIITTGGATGIGLSVVGGGTSGDGIKVVTTSGHGLNLAPVGTNMHGLISTGGNGGTSDGIKAAAGTGGVDFRANQTGSITGNLSGSVGSVTGAVGSVTGAVGSVTGAVGSVTGAVGSVTGAVGSVTATVTTGAISNNAITAAAFAADAGAEIADAVWDELLVGHAGVGSAGLALTSAGALGTPLDAAGVRAAIGLASANLDTQIAAVKTDTAAVKVQTDKLVFTVANKLDVNILYVNGVQVNGAGTVGSPWSP